MREHARLKLERRNGKPMSKRHIVAYHRAFREAKAEQQKLEALEGKPLDSWRRGALQEGARIQIQGTLNGYRKDAKPRRRTQHARHD